MITQSPNNGSFLAPDEVTAVELHSPPTTQSLSALIGDRLRGRWRPALITGAVLAVVMAGAGFHLAPVRFSSTGTVHVAPRGLTILRETIDTRILPRSEYETFLRTQVRLMRSDRVIGRALENTEVAALEDGVRPTTHKAISKRLRVETERGTELIMASFESESPSVAMVVLNAVLESYEELFGDTSKARRDLRMGTLRRMRNELSAERTVKLENLKNFIAATPQGTAELQTLLGMKLLRVEELRQQLERADLEASLLSPPAAPSASEPDAYTTEPTGRQLDGVSASLAAIRLQHHTQRVRVEQLERELNPGLPVCRQARRELEILAQLLAERERAERVEWRLAVARPVGQSEPAVTPGILALRQERIEALLQDNEKQVRALTRDLAEWEALNRALNDTERQLAEVEERVRTFQTEGGPDELFSGRITIVARGVESTTPSKDRRRSMAGLGGCAGLATGLGLFFVLGTVDRRTFGARQLHHGGASVRCLGVLPDLRSNGDDLNEMTRASDCVHQIRNRIATVRPADDGVVLAVSSPDAGDGKTTVAMALAWSHAAARHPTIIVDADLVGRSLSRQTGCIDAPGLREILKSRGLDEHVEKTIGPNLSVLPCGLDVSIGPESIRRDDFAWLCAHLRRAYDVIIIDTGPVIGSVELLPVLAAATGVVLVVKRGASRARIDDAINIVNDAGIPVTGIVLNRADELDCRRYVSESSTSRSASHASGSTPGRVSDVGGNVLVRAMARSCSEDG